jgi:putative transposase
MKHSKYSDSRIMEILKQAQSGVTVAVLCREHGMSQATFYQWRAKYGGMDARLIARLKTLELENKRLKKMYADVQLDAEILKEALAKKW